MANLNQLAQQAGEMLLEQRKVLSVAESCTGGWVAKCITDIAGSSQWFDRGFVTYSNEAKQEMLGVKSATLQMQGAVSEEAVREMARGVLQHSAADVAIAISGIAGPGGGSPGRPVGTVCFAWLTRDGLLKVETRFFSGDREAVRRHSVIDALEGLLNVLRSG